jgi:hypothetical protein
LLLAVLSSHGVSTDIEAKQFLGYLLWPFFSGLIRKCFELLGGNYPNWEESLRRELKEFAQGLTEHQRKATLTGAEIDGALRDPRWAAQEFLTGD